MPTPDERHAIQRHAGTIEAYRAAEAAERDRLERPYRGRRDELQELILRANRPADPDDRITVRPATADDIEQLKTMQSIVEEDAGIGREIQAGIDAWRASRSAPDPFKTPAEIADHIELVLQAAAFVRRQWRQRSLSPHEPIIAAEIEEYENTTDDVLAYQPFAPSVARDELVRWHDDHLRGMRDLRTWCREAMLPVPTAGEAGRRPTHNSDFTSINWFGEPYTFTPGQQAEAVAALWHEWDNGRHGLSERSIGELVGSGSDTFRLVHVFRIKEKRRARKVSFHPAWGKMIQKIGPRLYKLVGPD